MEDLTRKLCGAAWGLFQEIEAGGGVAAALQQGLIQSKVAAVRAEREKAVAHRKDALTGVSEFPNIYEVPAKVLDAAPVRVALGGTLPQIRLAEPFEALRDASDRVLAATGARPRVFLANLGTLAEFTAGATFAKNFFEAGGIEAVGDDYKSRSDMIAAFKASGAKLVCLCSTDEVYTREAVDAAKALATAGATRVYLAGRPRETEALKVAGVGSFIFAGCDALAALREAYLSLPDRV
jgi:methylmalonyl-CoA mutase